MADDDLLDRITAERARRELARRRADPVGTAVKKVAGQQGGGLTFGLQGDEDLAYRGQLLPLGRTQSGKIVPALPQAFQDAAQMTKKAAETGQMPSVPEALSTGLAFSPAGVAGRGAARALIPGEEGKPPIPTTEALQAAKSAAYQASEAAGVAIKPEAFRDMVGSIVDTVKSEEGGFDPTLHPNAAAVLNRLQRDSASKLPGTDLVQGQAGLPPRFVERKGSATSLKELDQLRQIARGKLKEAARAGNDSDVRINSMIVDKIDEFVGGLNKDQVTSGNFEEGVSSLKRARELAMRASKSDEIDDVFEMAELRAGEYRASGAENALRAEFKKLAGNKKKMGRYTQEERDAINDAATTANFQRGLVSLGKFSPTAGAAGMFLGAAALGNAAELHTYFQNPALMALPAAGFLARFAATKLRKDASKTVQELVRGGTPMSDYRMQQAMRGRNMSPDLKRGALMVRPPGSPPTPPAAEQPDEFNPLKNPGAT